MYIVLAILVFGFLIFIHELGHFLAAKKLGVQVNEFAICMGPAIYQKTVGETTYSLRSIPMGGYCAMEGEDENNENPRAFTNAKAWKRVVILLAGAFMNFLTGVVVLFCLLSANDYTILPTIDGFQDNAVIAESGGLEVGDTFYSVDGERVYTYDNVTYLMSRNETAVFDLVVVRDGEKVALDDFPMAKQTFLIDGVEKQLYGMNFTASENSLGQTFHDAWYGCIDFARLVRLGLGDLISGMVDVQDMSGALGVVTVMSEAGTSAETTELGLYRVFYLAAFIAVNLAVMNLLPLPALDGGRIVGVVITSAIEKVTKKRINPKYEGYIHGAGMVALLALMVLITFFDITKLFTGGIV